MTLGLFLYKLLTSALTPVLGVFFRLRVRRGKEDAERHGERFARGLSARPDGKLIWLHAASVGESQLLLELVRRLVRTQATTPTFLFTCQTMTAARLVSNMLAEDSSLTAIRGRQQMCVYDSPGAAQRFLDHWKPDIAIFAEGEIWINLLLGLEKRGIPTVLLNARMTENSLKGWMRWSKTARRVFGSFESLIAADMQTKTGLEALSGKPVTCPGNLKSALPAPDVEASELAELKAAINGRPVLLAASTHSGEEALALDAYMKLPPDHVLIIAPRHPERGDEVDALLSCTRYAIARRSEDDKFTQETDILLADTMGEMGLWYRLADTVYLGGGHAPGVGGHNPLEALRLKKPVVTGPSVFNFADLTKRLKTHQGFSLVADAEAIAAGFPAPPVSAEMTTMLEQDALGPMSASLEQLAPILEQAGIRP